MQNPTQEKPKLYYCEKVDVTFQTYRKSIIDCISAVCNYLLVSSHFESEQVEQIMNLLNLLNNQRVAVENFLKDYSRVKEEV